MSARAAIKYDNNVQEIRGTHGEKMYILSEAEYTRLMEMAEDISDMKAVRVFEQKLAAGEEELVPAEIAERLIDGENPVRVWREYRGFSAKFLAENIGIGSSYLSQIESGTKNGTIELYKKLAKFLRLTVDDLI